MQNYHKKIQSAIKKTLSLLGRDYDYSFNFYSDASYVCSTLITKAYLPDAEDQEGLHITLTHIATGITYPPNHLIKKIKNDRALGRDELDFVAFLDSIEKTGENFFSDEASLFLSGDRPKLSFFLP